LQALSRLVLTKRGAALMAVDAFNVFESGFRGARYSRVKSSQKKQPKATPEP